MRVLDFALAARLSDTLAPLLAKAEGWAKEWGVGPAESRVFYLACHRVSAAAARPAFPFLVAYLATFEASSPTSPNSPPIPAEALALAAQAATDFVSARGAYTCDLLSLPAVQALASSPAHAPIHALLTVFLTGKLADYLAFATANGPLLASRGLDVAAGAEKMRLLTLATLASEATASAASAGEIPYATIQLALQIGPEEVEAWVVRGIQAKLVEAVMDQLKGVVVVTRSTQRVFGPAQWIELRARLAQWKENLASATTSLAAAVQAGRLSGPAGGGAAGGAGAAALSSGAGGGRGPVLRAAAF